MCYINRMNNSMKKIKGRRRVDKDTAIITRSSKERITARKANRGDRTSVGLNGTKKIKGGRPKTDFTIQAASCNDGAIRVDGKDGFRVFGAVFDRESGDNHRGERKEKEKRMNNGIMEY